MRTLAKISLMLATVSAQHVGTYNVVYQNPAQYSAQGVAYNAPAYTQTQVILEHFHSSKQNLKNS